MTVNVLFGKINLSYNITFLSFLFIYKCYRKHPLHEAGLLRRELAHRKLQHQLVPTLLQGDIYRRTRHVVLILQRNLVRAFGIRILPNRRHNFLSIEPGTTALVIPGTLTGSQIAFRTTVVLEFQHQLGLSFLWRINPPGSVSGMVFLRIGIETRNQCTPDMTEIDTVADNLAAVIGVTLILIYGIFLLLRWEHLVQIASVREGIGNLPFTLGLTDVWEWNLLQPGILLPQQAAS